jgi:hypothetical protein
MKGIETILRLQPGWRSITELLPFVAAIVLFSSVSVPCQVDTAWVRLYDGQGSQDDRPSAMGIGGASDVYLTGVSFGNGPDGDILTLNYDSAGQLTWEREFNGPGDGYDRAFTLGMDHAENIYVSGRVDGISTLQDYITLKYDSAGTLLWERHYSSSLGSSRDEARALVVDQSASLYVTGISDCQGTAPLRTCDCVTIRYTPGGDTVWTRRYGRILDYALAINTDFAGNILVVSSRRGFAESWDLLLLKYDPDGSLLWHKEYDAPVARHEFARGLAIDDDGSVFITGYSWIEGDSVTVNYVTVKYSSDGEFQWARVFEEDKNQLGYTGSNDFGQPIQIDFAGNILVTGRSFSAITGYDCVTIKYDTDGNLLWQRRFSTPGSTWDEGHAIELDGFGNAYVIGASEMPGSSYDFITLKYSPSGDLEWGRSFNGSANGVDLPQVVRLDALGNTFVTGCVGGGSPYYDYCTIKYVPVCRCYNQADTEPDGFITALDLAATIDALFAGAENPQDPDCPTFRFDLDCDGFATALDLAGLIDHLFAGGEGPCDPCAK